VIGAGSIVTKDVPAYAIMVGNPARLVRMRFPPEVAVGLERLAWWEWSHDRLRVALPEFRALSAEAFLAKYG
jgi:acyl-[acyl carrier protein]--UDP-N-acetylglucosamine O-acyltransferase